MEKFKVSFEANNQQLKSIGTKHASDTYADIEATFVLGEKWTDMDSVSAVWWNDFTRIATVLDSQGKCTVPHEVLTRKGCVRVNLVGSIVEGDELVTRLTSYSAEAVQVNEKIKLTGNETSEITPSQYEQFVATVKADADRAEAGATASANSADEAEASAQNASESASASAVSASDSARSATASAGYAQNASESAQNAENAKDDAEDARDEILGMRATANTLEAGSDATASYSDGLLTLGIPRGDRGEQGIQGETGATPNLTIGTVETLEPTEDATASITGTAENPVLNLGLPKGDTGEVSLEDLEALLPTDTASGDIVSIPDGQSVVPAKSLKVALEPIQAGSGTPSPDNVRPISGRTEVVTHRTGVNVWDEEWEIGTLNYDTGQEAERSNAIRSKNYNRIAPNTTYCVRRPNAMITNDLRVFYYDADKNFIQVSAWLPSPASASYSTITTPSNCAYFKIIAVNTTVYANDISINYPSTDHDYHAYDGETYTTDLGQTVYGGEVEQVGGSLTDKMGMMNLGDLTWANNNTGTNAFEAYAITSLVKPYTTNLISNALVQKSSFTDVAECTIRMRDNFLAVKVPKTIATSGAQVKQWLTDNGVTLCYELATPQTIQLTPQEVKLLLGTNNIWSDGNVTLVYSADIQKWVEKKLNGNSTTLTMSRPMTAELNETETETTETEETE